MTDPVIPDDSISTLTPADDDAGSGGGGTTTATKRRGRRGRRSAASEADQLGDAVYDPVDSDSYPERPFEEATLINDEGDSMLSFDSGNPDHQDLRLSAGIDYVEEDHPAGIPAGYRPPLYEVDED